ncbi:MAG: response regulator [Clostridia bacterium]|nr:response regulator [Clostridia bacterium]
MKAIIVDDEIDALTSFIKYFVDNSNLDIRMFSKDQIAAIEYAKNSRVDAAFLDINMSPMNGVEMALKLIEHLPHIQIVFVTGYVHNEEDIERRIGEKNFVGWCYKPYDFDTLYKYCKLAKARCNAARPKLKTFGYFDIFLDECHVQITSQKAKELLAYMCDRCGETVSMSQAVCALWPDREYDKAKILYRDAAWRLRRSLRRYGIEDIVAFRRGECRILTERCDCDLWEYISNNNCAINYNGEYMQSYDWSITTQNMLDRLHVKRAMEHK